MSEAADQKRAATGPAESAEFEQLSLESTMVGPGTRAADVYEPGTLLKIKGERGTYTYRHASVSSEGRVSLHLVGDHAFRAVRPEQVSPVKKGRRGT